MKDIRAELRIGNWLQSKEGNFKLNIDSFIAVLQNKGVGKYSPIILNQFILESTSFHRTNEKLFFDSEEGIVYSYLNYTYSTGLFLFEVYNSEEEIIGGGSEPVLTIKNVIYLHQLQNLIFALEESELEVNLKNKGIDVTR